MSAVTLSTITPEPTTAPVIVTTTTTGAPAQTVVVTQKGLMDQMAAKAIWVFIIIAIIVLIILFWISTSGSDWFNTLNNTWNWIKGSALIGWAVLLVVGVLLAAFVSAVAYANADVRTRGAIIALFGLTMLFLIIWFAVFYSNQNLYAAAWLGGITVILSIFWAGYVWKGDARAGWGMIPYLLWAVVAFAFNIHLSLENRAITE